MQRSMDAQQLRLEMAPSDPSEASGATRAPALRPNSPESEADRISASAVDTPSEPKHTVSRPSAAELLETPGALLTRSDLRGLGLERRAIDAVFRSLAVVALPGYSRPMIRAEEFARLVEHYTYRDDRVRPRHA